MIKTLVIFVSIKIFSIHIKINAHIVLRAIIIEFIGFISVYPITSPIIGLVDMLRYNKNDKNDVAAESLNSLSLQW